ncbi:hypothetical protein IAQ61_001929 [Plenodomus lingam]|uniref:uncharacterized protein n=1 Tax=Leptosphaeria maculans TaxID=5022 RepID=UPI0033186B0A|nr:hypothetical protein IAQ61_001929 [Plenodomus lingam]
MILPSSSNQASEAPLRSKKSTQGSHSTARALCIRFNTPDALPSKPGTIDWSAVVTSNSLLPCKCRSSELLASSNADASSMTTSPLSSTE